MQFSPVFRCFCVLFKIASVAGKNGIVVHSLFFDESESVPVADKKQHRRSFSCFDLKGGHVFSLVSFSVFDSIISKL